MRMYDSLFPWSVIPSDTGRGEVCEAGNEAGRGNRGGLTSVCAAARFIFSEIIEFSGFETH